MKLRQALKKVFASKTTVVTLISLAVLAVVSLVAAAVVLYPKHIEKSNKEAAERLLQQIALAQMSLDQGCCMGACYPPLYLYTDGVDETPETAIMGLIEACRRFFDKSDESCLRPDPSLAFHIMRPEPVVVNNERVFGFIAFAAHDSAGSPVYLYNNITGDGVEVASEGAEYSINGTDIAINFSKVTLYRYKYDPNNKDNPVVRLPGQVKIGPDPKDASPRRMIVIEAAG